MRHVDVLVDDVALHRVVFGEVQTEETLRQAERRVEVAASAQSVERVHEQDLVGRIAKIARKSSDQQLVNFVRLLILCTFVY